MSDYSGVLGDGVLGNFTLGDDPSSDTFAFGQAQADIKQTYNGFAQPQADIKQTYNGFSQGRGDIKQTYFGFAQAQANIVHTYFGCAQSQANIKQTYYGFAQAQARILQVYRGYGQAQGYLPANLGQVYAQALAFICWIDTFTRSTSFGLGSDYTWQEWDSFWGAPEDSLYKLDGNKVINTDIDNNISDSYSLNRTIPVTGTA